VVSAELLARNVLSGEKSSDHIFLEWTLMGWVRDSPSLFQAMSSPPSSPLAINRPFLDIATLRTLKRWPSIIFNTTPFSKSHKRSVLSYEAVTIRRLSGKTAAKILSP